jgi:hypothetical protein
MANILLAALAIGPFCGVSRENLRDTPNLRYEQFWSADAAALGRLAGSPDAAGVAPAGGQIRADTGFRLAWDCELAAGAYQLDVVAVAPDRGSDSLHVSLNGTRLRNPLVLPVGAAGQASLAFPLTSAGRQRFELTLREGPGCMLSEAKLSRLKPITPAAPVRPELATRHPRLLITPAGLDRLKAKAADPRLAQVYRLPNPLTTRPRPYKAGQRNGSDFVGLGDHVLRYLLQPDTAQLSVLLAWLEVAASYGDVGVDLDAEYFAEGVALAYDWLYSDIPPALRDRLRDRLAANCDGLFVASLAGTTGGGLSFQQNHYWFAHLALALSAAALVGEHPQAETWLAWAWDRYERIALSFGPDGGFHEGPGYWDYSMPTLYLYTDLYESLTGLRAPALDAGLHGQAEFRLRQLLPGFARTAPLEDTKIGAGRPSAATLYWEATRFRDPVVQALPAAIGCGPSDRKLALLWYDPDLQAAPTPLQGLPLAHHYPDLGTVLARTSWEPQATFAAFVCRPLGGWSYADVCARFHLGGTGHNHPGQGHFLLAAGETLLAGDTGYTYVKTTRDHNTILVDGKGQYGDGEMWPSPRPGRPRITAYAADGDIMIVSAQVADAYPPAVGVRRFDRTFILAGDRFAVVYDRLAADAPRTFSWLLHHWGSVAEDAADRVITSDDKRLRVQPLLPATPACRQETYRPQYVHPTRDLTPKTPDVNLLQFDTGPVADATFLVALVIGPGTGTLPRAEIVTCPGGIGVRLGATTVFCRGDTGPLTVPGAAPGGADLTTMALAAVLTERQGKPIVLLAETQP